MGIPPMEVFWGVGALMGWGGDAAALGLGLGVDMMLP